jgi:tetratricopeptide (TPR) repeat protein
VLLAKGETNEALENYRKALTILEREPVRSAQRMTLANAYEGLGNLHLFRANRATGQTPQQGEHFAEARDWYQKSADVWRALDQQGKSTGEAKTTTNRITQKIEQCNAALTKLKARSTALGAVARP